MKPISDYNSSAYYDLLDLDVVSADGKTLGNLHGMWSDHTTGSIEYLGVKASWFFGKNSVVPAVGAEVEEEKHCVRVPYTAACIKAAPQFATGAEIDEKHEEEIDRYYMAHQPANCSIGITEERRP
jgi:ribosomal 30S subunit maturation factor RimM